MSRIAYILLCHKEPEAIVAQANRLTAAGDYIAIHFDAVPNMTRLKPPCQMFRTPQDQMWLGGVVTGSGNTVFH